MNDTRRAAVSRLVSKDFKYLREMSDDDLIGAYCYAGGVLGHGVEPWLVWALSDWLTGAETELKRRGLLKDAKRAEKAMWKDYHARRKLESKGQAHNG